MSDHLVSLIRTYVPLGVGAGLTWLASVLGVVVDESTSTAATVAAVGIASAAYYTVVRQLEKRWPALGVLLGSTKQPAYSKPY